MKKFFTLFAAASLAVGAFAQIESANIDPEALGLSSDLSEVAEGTVLASSESVTMSAAFTDQAKTNAVKADECTGGWINGEFYASTGGIQGNSNPKTCTLTTAPTEGWVMRFDSEKTGYIVALSKLSSNKNYWVFEGTFGTEEKCVAYTAGILWNKEVGTKDQPEAIRTPYVIDMPADDMGYINLDAADIDTYVNVETGATRQLRQIIAGPDTELTGDGYGFLAFPVYPGVPYLMCAQGSKMTVCGFIFIPSDNDEDATPAKPAAIGVGTEEATLYTFDLTAGINDIVVEEAVVDANAPVYNVLGQRVSKDAKGLLIQNGRKFYNR